MPLGNFKSIHYSKKTVRETVSLTLRLIKTCGFFFPLCLDSLTRTFDFAAFEFEQHSSLVRLAVLSAFSLTSGWGMACSEMSEHSPVDVLSLDLAQGPKN